MCLPDFKRFEQISGDSPLIGYRTWKHSINSLILKSEYQNYTWKDIEGPHEVLEVNSGIYAYNNNNYNNNYYNNNNYYYYYNYGGIILQWGKVAIHKDGQRSEFTRIKALFTIRENDAKGSKEFLNWIVKFNNEVREVAKIYKCDTIHWQDFKDSQA